MVVGQHTLATLVRQTAINAYKVLQEDKGKPFTIRRFLIDDFIQRNRVDQPIHHYFASQLTF